MTKMTEEKVQAMIDDAIKQHNHNATIISMIIGFAILAAFLDGFFRLAGITSPFMGIDISILPRL